MPLGASYLCSVPWLHPQPVTIASCHMPGRALCHTEAQQQTGGRLAQTYTHLGEIKLKACVPPRGPVQQSKGEQYILQRTGLRAVTTRGGSVCAAPWHGWLWATWPQLLNVASFQSSNFSEPFNPQHSKWTWAYYNHVCLPETPFSETHIFQVSPALPSNILGVID